MSGELGTDRDWMLAVLDSVADTARTLTAEVISGEINEPTVVRLGCVVDVLRRSCTSFLAGGEFFSEEDLCALETIGEYATNNTGGK